MAKKSIPQLVSLAPATRPLNGTEAVHCSQGGVSKGLSLNMGVVTVTGNYSVAAGISTVLVNAASATITLPAISYVGQELKIAKVSDSAGTVTVNCASGQLIYPDVTGAIPLTEFGTNLDLIAITSTKWARRGYRLLNLFFKYGSELSIPGIGYPAICTLNSTTVVFIDAALKKLSTYTWDGSDWTLTGNQLTISGMNIPALCALNSTTVAFIDAALASLRTYAWSGSAWSLSSSGLSIPGIGNHALCALNSTTVAFIDDTLEELTTYISQLISA